MATIIDYGLGLPLVSLNHCGEPLKLVVHIVERGIGHAMDVLGRHAKSLLAIHGKHLAIVECKGHRLLVLVVLVRDDQHKGFVFNLGINRNAGVDLVISPHRATRHRCYQQKE